MSPFPLSRAEARLNRIGHAAIEAAMRRAGRWLPPDAAAAAHEGAARYRAIDGMTMRPLSDADRALINAAIAAAILNDAP